MITINNEKTSDYEELQHDHTLSPPFTLTKNAAEHTLQNNHQQVIQHEFITHQAKAGLNPLVDAAAYLFSLIGKLKNLESYSQLAKLQQEFILEIHSFEVSVKTLGYSSEYILVSRYALSATIDDIILNTPWGAQGEWKNYSILDIFNQESSQQDRFFLILERIIKNSKLYIDLMEFMYMCLSLGYKGSFRSTEYSNNQLEKITHSLYKRIRKERGDFSKTLSPFPIRAAEPVKKNAPKISYWYIFFLTASIIMLIFIGLGYLLDNISNQAYQELMHIGKSILYESNPH